MKYDVVLFDLDGTLTDPKVGITKSVAYALNMMNEGNIDVDLDDLAKFVGPPLKDSFMNFYQMSDDDAEQAIQYYRDYFKGKGIFENEIYDGIKDLLKNLIDAGVFLAVVTSKPTVFAEMILQHFGINTYFYCVVGSNLDGTRTQKAEVIAEVLDRMLVTDDQTVAVVGDREYDVLGAKKYGLTSIAVQYGFASDGELENAEPDFAVSTVKDLGKLLLGK